jgi:hypothetical protein
MEGLINPFGKVIPQPFILRPNHQNIYLAKNQINWCRDTAFYFSIIDYDYFLFINFESLANEIEERIKNLVNG